MTEENANEQGRWPLPTSWTWCRMGELGDVIGGGTPKNASDPANYDDSGTPWITPADLSGYSRTYFDRGKRSLSEVGFYNSAARVLPSGSVLLSSRAPVGYCVIARNPISTNQGFKSLVPNSAVAPEYVRHYLLASRDYLQSKASGTTFLELSGRATSDLIVPLAPLNEQRRIVERIDELFSQIEAGEAALARAKRLLVRYRQAVLKAAVTGELTKDWRERHQAEIEPATHLLARILQARREAWEKAELQKLKAKGKPPKDDTWKKKYKDPEPPDTTDLPDLPEGWVWASLDQLVAGRPRSLQSGPFGSNLRHSEFTENGILVLGIDNVLNGDFSFGRQNRISQEKFGELRKYAARPRDLLITVMASLGRSCIVPEKLEAAIITKHVYRVTTPVDLVVPEFLNLVIQAEATTRKKMLSNAQGQTRPGLNGGILASLPIPLPSYREQLACVEMLDAVLSEIEPLGRSFIDEQRRAAALRQAILTAAFAGKLVPQDPADEPAAGLLARIKAERVDGTTAPRPPRNQIVVKRQARSSMPLNRRSILRDHLVNILRTNGKEFTAEELYKASELEIDDFYKQLRDEVALGLIVEDRKRRRLKVAP